ncbi:MAG: hypothetical protein HOP00_09550 [Nitrospira sp.]|nr:hypothetical protein [Nitrospira sp.]
MSDLFPQEVDPQERISRYLLLAKSFDAKAQIVFAQAFKPPRPTTEFPVRQTSVYRTQGVGESEIWELGDQFVTQLHSKHWPVLGRADLTAKDVSDADLTIVPNPDPHPRHADIEGWPSHDEEIEMKITYLARKALLKIRS